MKDRFEGADGRPARLDALQRQKLLRRNDGLAEKLADMGEVVECPKGEVLIREGGTDTEVFFILAGRFEVRVKGTKVAERSHDTLVGEIANLRPSRRRSATLTALEDSVVLKVNFKDLKAAVQGDASFWQAMADEMAERLAERNATLPDGNERPRVLVVSSSEGLKTARALRQELGKDEDIEVEVWEQIFAISSYPLDALEEAMKRADFVVAIMRGDDIVVSREMESRAPRDNVILEYGMALGKLGRNRTLMMVPKEIQTKLASDNSGLTYVPYTERDLKVSIPLAGDRIREHVELRGMKG
ncbi:TIR domain-containing protein [Methylorubrum extorquens]|uniref:Cyclic nucleotide-binding n=1 Tax=Methylorubrum extorquens (strain CM4 / NCIMB 13688) TaxID=440085 RepID=B7L3G5_METC4|nr:TIR domain-containing protein [Methylorubrum extorquens]ACK86373.1 cyclic nucleotide-binding [Methylorubrum extorquens CM4]